APLPAPPRLALTQGSQSGAEPETGAAPLRPPPAGPYRGPMETTVAGTPVHYVEHGRGTPVLVLHGAGVDHREAVAAFEPGLAAAGEHRRIYPDLPGMGRTPADARLTSNDDVVDLILGLVDELIGPRPYLVAGHSYG